MDIHVDTSSPVPLYQQIVQQIRSMIEGGVLPQGFRLPPERKLARELHVNRGTVLNAYRELKASGLIGAHVGRGTEVLPQQARERGEGGPIAWRQLFRTSTLKSEDPLLRDLLRLTERQDMISLAVGLPSPDLLPLDRFQEVVEELLRDVGSPLLLHCPTEGLSPLREALSDWMESRGIAAGPAETLVLSGSQQALDLAARAFLEPGDAVVVEEPTYIGALEVFRTAQARVLGVPTDEDGMRVDVLESMLERHRPKLVYTLPTFQNPAGTVMSLERRERLLELANRHRIPILEDDPYSELRYDGDAVPSLKSMDEHDQVLYVSTFSKTLFPGLRVGWLAAPPTVVRQLTLVKQGADLHSNSLGQWVIERFLRSGRYEEHLGRVRRGYASRRNAMEAALRRHAPPRLRWQRPDGGFYFWCRLPAGTDETRLVTHAAEGGMSFLPGWACFPDAPDAAWARLNFSFPTEDRIGEGVRLFTEAVRHVATTERRPDRVAAGTPPIV